MMTKDWDAKYAKRPQRWSLEPNDRLVHEVGQLTPGRALDVGCGEGRNAIWLASKGWQVSAVDMSAIAIERGERRAGELGLSIEWTVADFATLQLEPTFDLVIVVFLQTPADERREWMIGARSALRVGGTFLYIGHDRSNFDHGHGGPRYPEVLCTPQDIVRELPGFRIDTARVVERPVSIESGHGPASETATALDAVVRAVRLQ